MGWTPAFLHSRVHLGKRPLSRDRIGRPRIDRGRRSVAFSNAGEAPFFLFWRMVTSGGLLRPALNCSCISTSTGRERGSRALFSIRSSLILEDGPIGRDMFLFLLGDFGDCLHTNPCLVHPRFPFQFSFLFSRSRHVMSMMQKAYHWLYR